MKEQAMVDWRIAQFKVTWPFYEYRFYRDRVTIIGMYGHKRIYHSKKWSATLRRLVLNLVAVCGAEMVKCTNKVTAVRVQLREKER
jgi:hypothetical protein